MISDYRLKTLDCVKGIDVSSIQTDINWKIAYEVDNIRFAFVKISEDIYPDAPRYKHDNPLVGRCREVQVQGIKLGYYHFCRPGSIPSPIANAVREADQFIIFLKNLPKPDFPLVLDLEAFSGINCWSPAIRSKNLKAYIQTFENILSAHNYKMMIYTTKGFMDANMPDFSAFNRWSLWIANFVKPENHLPVMPGNLKNTQWDIWQYDNEGEIEASRMYGRYEVVDLNIMKTNFFNTY